MDRGNTYFEKRMKGKLSKLFYATWVPPRRLNTEDFIKQNISKLNPENRVILDIGCSVGKGRTLNKKLCKNHFTLDIDISLNPDYVGDAQHFVDENKLENKFDFIFSIGILEHIHEPQKVIDEIHRALKDGGKTAHWAPFIYRVHAKYGDYWRFTEDGLKYLFRNYKDVKVEPSDGFFSVAVRMFYEATAPLKDLGFIIRICSFPLVWSIIQLDRFTPQHLYCRGYYITAKK